MNFFHTESLLNAFNQALAFHAFFAFLVVLPYIWNLFVLYTYKTYLGINQKMFFIMPLTFFLLSVNFFTGIFLHSMMVFKFSLKIYLMLFIVIIFIVGEILRIIKLKNSKISAERMKIYTLFCKRMYILFVVLYLILLSISYIL